MVRWLPALAFFGFIVWIIIDADLGGKNLFIQMANSIPYGDKIGHACIYATMAIFVTVASKFRCWSWRQQHFYVGSTVVLGFALLEEGSQYFLTTRNFDGYDALADIVGILLAGVALRYWQRRRLVAKQGTSS